MGSPDGDSREISRRKFLKQTGSVALIGALGLGLDPLGSLLKSRSIGPTPAATSQGNLPAPAFTVFWLTDTQYLSEANPALYSRATDWVAKNWKAMNGKLVIHTGDLVQTGAELQQWVSANKAMKTLSDNGIPYLWTAGNHDDLVQDDPTFGWAGSKFDSFNPSVVGPTVNTLGYARWAGDYRDGMNTAVAFTANGLKFLVVALEWNAPPDALVWLQAMLDDRQYQDHYVIAAPHAYEDAYGSTNDQRWGPTLTEFRQRLRGILDSHGDRVFLTLNGHFATDSGFHTSAPINGRNQLMFDRQESTDDPNDPLDASVKSELKVGGATVTLLRFDTAWNTVVVKTFDAYNGYYRDFPQDDYSFTMFPSMNQIRLTPNQR